MTDRAKELIARVRELDKAYWVARAEKAERELALADKAIKAGKAGYDISVEYDGEAARQYLAARHQAREGR